MSHCAFAVDAGEGAAAAMRLLHQWTCRNEQTMATARDIGGCGSLAGADGGETSNQGSGGGVGGGAPTSKYASGWVATGQALDHAWDSGGGRGGVAPVAGGPRNADGGGREAPGVQAAAGGSEDAGGGGAVARRVQATAGVPQVGLT